MVKEAAEQEQREGKAQRQLKVFKGTSPVPYFLQQVPLPDSPPSDEFLDYSIEHSDLIVPSSFNGATSWEPSFQQWTLAMAITA